MKKQYIFWLIIVVFAIVSCTKHPFDHRNKYLGKWGFEVEYVEINTDSVGYYYYDKWTYIGEIKYGKKDDEILIKYSDNNSVTLLVDKNGILSGFPNHYSSGKFESKNKIEINLKISGGLGGGISHRIKGEK